MRSKFRVSAEKNGRRSYIRFTVYKDDVYFSTENMNANYKSITGEQFVSLTFKLQAEGYTNLLWERLR